jgi:alginate export protein
MRNRPRADRQGTLGELCSPRRVRQSACTNPIIPAMTQPSVRTPDGAPPRRLAGGTRTRTARCQGVAVIMGLALQLLSCVHGMLPAWAQTGQAASELKRPDYQIRRFDEDWSVLRGVDRSKTDDFWDRVKFIALTEDQNVWLTLAGQVRERLEYFNEFEFGASAPEQSDVYLLSRFRLSADLHVSRYFRIFAEGKSALSTDRKLLGGNTTTFMDTIDLQNGFADIMIPLGDQASVTLRGGRQELLFGAQRLVGVSDFTNVRRTFDGGAGIVRVGDWTITPLWMELVVVQKYRFNESSADQKLYGIYGTGPAPLLPVNLDLYWLGVDNAGVTFNGTSGREQRQTLGGRVWGKIGETGLDFEVEGAGQFGTVGDADIAAWMITGILGYTLPAPRLSPRVYLEFDYASGDGRPGGNVGTFNPLYPTAHSFLGYIDYVGRQNIISPNAGLTMSPISHLSVSLQQYFFWRASDRDAFYSKTGAVLRPGTETTARYIGAEIDLLATNNVTRHLLGYAGYSHFFTGEFLRKTGPSKDSDFFYTAMQYTF